MSNIEKKLDALIDALGFDIKTTTKFDYRKEVSNNSADPLRMYVLEGGSNAYLIDDNGMYTSRLNEPIIDYELIKHESKVFGILDGHKKCGVNNTPAYFFKDDNE
jgi:hypothetical protein